MGKKEFEKAARDNNVKVFAIHIVSLTTIHPTRKTQIAFLFIKRIKILDKYLN